MLSEAVSVDKGEYKVIREGQGWNINILKISGSSGTYKINNSREVIETLRDGVSRGERASGRKIDNKAKRCKEKG